MKHVVEPIWPRRVTPLVLSALIAAGALLLLNMVLEFQDPVWSRPAIVLQLLAVACASAALRARWMLSRRFIAYPLILAIVIYLWDLTLPPPSLPEGAVRNLVPRLALLGLVVDMAIWRHRRRAASIPVTQSHQILLETGAPVLSERRTPVRHGLIRLDDAARFFRTSEVALRSLLERTGGAPLRNEGREYLRLNDLLRIVALRNSTGIRHAAYTHADLPRRLYGILGVGWLVLTIIVAIAPGIELRLILDGQAPSTEIFACLQPWVGWMVGGAALIDFLTLFIAVWVLRAIRQTAALAAVVGTIGGIGVGLLIGIPCP